MTIHEPHREERIVERPAEERIVERPAEERVVETTDAAETEEVVVRRRFAPAMLLGVVAGAVLIVFGIVALVRGDLVGSVNDPVVSVAGWDHTPLLGIIEIGAGVLLVLASFAARAEMLIGALIVIAGVVALIEPKVLSDNLKISSGLAWMFVILGAVPFLVAALASMMPARTARRVHTVQRA